jgi:beta-glucanase (GH16 family)
VEWSPSAIIWRVDGVEYFRVTNTQAISNEPMYLILDTEIGAPGSWPGAPHPSSVFPGTMDIDYVRIYQASNAAPLPRQFQ